MLHCFSFRPCLCCFHRIYDQLHLCGVQVPHKLSATDISSFIDVKLQHGHATLVDTSCEHDISGLMPPETWSTTDPEHIRIYREVGHVVKRSD